MAADGHTPHLYTPVGHPLAQSLLSRRTSKLMARRQRWPADPNPNASLYKLRPSEWHDFDHFTRRFPVEKRYLAETPSLAPCLKQTYQLPPPSLLVKNECEPKFSCGSARAFAERTAGCAVWSIGSAGETCFEEYLHAQAPNCRIDVFDPTLTPRGRERLGGLKQRGVLDFHDIGLADHRTVGGYSTFKDYRFDTAESRTRQRYCDTERALDPAAFRRMGCLPRSRAATHAR